MVESWQGSGEEREEREEEQEQEQGCSNICSFPFVVLMPVAAPGLCYSSSLFCGNE